MLRDALRRASSVIDARAKRTFYRDPQVSGTETRLYSVNQATGRLDIPEGIVSVAMIRVRRWTNDDTWTVLDPTTYFLVGAKNGGPSWSIRLTSRTSTWALFLPGYEVVEVTGVFGWPTVPEIVRAGTLALAREMVGDALTHGGTPSGDWENPNALLPTETYTAIRWGSSMGVPDWFA